MMVVSRELYEWLNHPEQKPRCKLKSKDMVARDTFARERIKLVSAAEFFGEKPKRKPAGKPRKSSPSGRCQRCAAT